MSTAIGVAPARNTAWETAGNVAAGTITSPLRPSAPQASWIAVVPLPVSARSGIPNWAESSASRRRTLGPSLVRIWLSITSRSADRRSSQDGRSGLTTTITSSLLRFTLTTPDGELPGRLRARGSRCLWSGPSPVGALPSQIYGTRTELVHDHYYSGGGR